MNDLVTMSDEELRQVAMVFADRRRADDGARRDHPGADPRPHARAAERELGMAMIWITHDLGVVAGLADRVIVMYAGGRSSSRPRCDRSSIARPSASLHPRRCMARMPGMIWAASAEAPATPIAPRVDPTWREPVVAPIPANAFDGARRVPHAAAENQPSPALRRTHQPGATCLMDQGPEQSRGDGDHGDEHGRWSRSNDLKVHFPIYAARASSGAGRRRPSAPSTASTMFDI